MKIFCCSIFLFYGLLSSASFAQTVPLKKTASEIQESYVYFLVLGDANESALSANSKKKIELPQGYAAKNKVMFDSLFRIFEKYWTFSEAKPVVIESAAHKGLLGTKGTPYFYFYLLRYGDPEKSPYLFYLAKSDEKDVRLTIWGFNHCCVEAHLILMVKSIQRQLEKVSMGISDASYDAQVRKAYNTLKHKTLLIPKEEIDKGISKEDIAKVYPWPFELTDLNGLAKAVADENPDYAVLLNRFSVAVNGTYYTTPGIFDAANGMEIWYPPVKVNATMDLVKLKDFAKMTKWGE